MKEFVIPWIFFLHKDKIGSFSHFFIFFLSYLKSCKSAKNIFLVWGGGYPLPESQNLLDILDKNLVIFYRVSQKKIVFMIKRFIFLDLSEGFKDTIK